MTERTQWHLSFDLAVMTRYWKAQDDEIKRHRSQRDSMRSHRNYPIRGNRGTGSNLPDPAPAERR